jgi:hypothetical protein
MKESYSEVLAKHAGPESYAGHGNMAGVATAGVHAGPEIELRYQAIPRAHTVKLVEGNSESIATGKIDFGRGGVEGPEHAWKLQTREPGDPIGCLHPAVTARCKDGQKTSPRVMLA